MVFEFSDVAFDEFGCRFAITGAEGFEDGAVLGEGRNEIGLIAYVAVPEAFGLAVEHVERLCEKPIVGSGPYLFVTDSIGGQQL